MKIQPFRNFTDEERDTWKLLFRNLEYSRTHQAHPIFPKGVKALGLCEDLPDLDEVNEILMDFTGWQGVPVEGLEDFESFYPGLAERKFPIGNFIRDRQDITYTPAPDIFHDLYGHLPHLTDPDFAQFCENYGRLASRYLGQPERIIKLERFFWFTGEFALVETPNGRRIFGGGILSSKGECDYSLSDKPTVRPFSVKEITDQDYRIDIMQETLFLLESPEQLYNSLSELESIIEDTPALIDAAKGKKTS
ncbi:MAG: phenylalanine 4-monooxygenase [Pseudobdellovibrionaceae bacterium]|nr:hypothetical protein [Bdellovibrionales bacterium]USN46357.1 MAG: phenylalanine 4-monooxygenase [Pseudobdellovibrionaceae bacterium]